MLLELLEKYNKDKHLESVYRNIQRKNIEITPIYSNKWKLNNNSPHISLSYLLDSYYLLNERPDLAFTFLWSSFNSIYNQIAYKHARSNSYLGNNGNISDNGAISHLFELIKSDNDDIILDLFKSYKSLIPHKQFRFLANIILKGYVFEKNKSSLNNLEKGIINYKNIRNKTDYSFIRVIDENYGEAYDSISSFNINNGILNFNVDPGYEDKSNDIIRSLSKNLKELILKGETIIYDRNKNPLPKVEFKDEYSVMKFFLKGLLYTTRNTSFHGNKGSRGNSDYSNNGTLKSSIYIYYLAHYFLSIGFYLSDYIDKNELIKINQENLTKLSTLLK